MSSRRGVATGSRLRTIGVVVTLGALALGGAKWAGAEPEGGLADGPMAGAPPTRSEFPEPDPGPDRIEPGSVDSIRAFTTSADHLPRSVAYLPDSDSVPSPTKALGYLIGTPDQLSDVATIHGYFRKLAAATDRVNLTSLGFSEEGREMLLIRISAPHNLARLDSLDRALHQLSDPRRTDEDTARRLIEETVPCYYLLGGLHSTETGSPEMLMELAYRLAVSERPEIAEIRENLVVLITPVVEPDGRQRVVEWYRRHLHGRELPYEKLREFSSPPYWGNYAYHDNNRDGMQETLALTRAVNGVFYRHRPLVVHDLHESVPLLYISTGHGPYTDAVDPVTINEWTQMAHQEASVLQADGLPGVWTWGFWDGWWPGYLFSVAMNHQAIGRFYETFGNSLPGTFTRQLDRTKYLGQPVTKAQWYRPWPPERSVTWSLRDNTNYMEAGVLVALEYAASQRATLLRNFWAKNRRAVKLGGSEKPFGWVFPAEQADPARLDYLIDRLRSHRIEVHRLSAEYTTEKIEVESVNGEASFLEDARAEIPGSRADTATGSKAPGVTRRARFPAGSFVVRMDQPNRGAAKNFLERQAFPDDEVNRPYDDVAWTWPLLYGVVGARIDDAALLEVPMERWDQPVHVQGRLRGSGSIFLIADRGENALLPARVALGQATVLAAEKAFQAEGREFPRGSWIVVAPIETMRQLVTTYGFDVTTVTARPDVSTHEIDLPRLGILHTWTETQTCGWVRYTLDALGMPYTLLRPEDVQGSGLDRIDVVIYPTRESSLSRILQGIDPEFGPLAYNRSPEYPSHGVPDGSDDVTGGIGFRGMEKLGRFLERGGVLLATGNGGVLPVDGGLVRRIDNIGIGQTPGSEVVAHVERPDHPLAYGYPEWTSVFRGRTALFDVSPPERSQVVLQFGTKKTEDPDGVPAAGQKEGEIEAPAESPAATTISTSVTLDLSGADPSVETAVESRGPEVTQTARSPVPTSILLSGQLTDPAVLDGKPAILDVPVGRGRVVIYAFEPLHRHLNHSDFRWLFNGILNWNDLDGE